MPTLAEQLDRRKPLKRLADGLLWPEFEKAFGSYYSAEGRPAKLVRLMVVLPTDLSGSGYDRGHMCPSADRTDTDTNNDATFYMANIIPQAPDCHRTVQNQPVGVTSKPATLRCGIS